MRSIVIERLYDVPSERFDALTSEDERVGSRVVRRLVEGWKNRANRFDGPGEALYGASFDGRLVGVCGLNIDPYAASERVGRVRHLYVLSAFRRTGVARRLLTHVLQAASGRFDVLRLRTTNPAAACLYEAVGFKSCAEQSDSTHITHLPLKSG